MIGVLEVLIELEGAAATATAAVVVAGAGAGVGAGGAVVSNELIVTTSSLKTSWGNDLANSALASEDLIYSAAQDSRRTRMEEPSGVSLQTWMRRGVAGMRPVVRRHSTIASSVCSHSPLMASL